MNKYIYFKLSSGEVIFIVAVAGDYNCNPANGELFCNYQGELDESFLRGETITEVGLCNSRNLASAMVASSVNYAKKGEKFLVSATLTLKQDGNCRFLAQPDGNDNIYVGSIFKGPYRFEGFQIAASRDYLPPDAIYFDKSSILETKNASGTMTDNTLTYSCGAFTVPVKEVVLLYENTPVLRAVADNSLNVKVVSVTASEAGNMLLSEDYVTELFNLTVDGSSVSNYFLTAQAESLSYLCQADYKMGADAVIKNGIKNSGVIVDSYGITLTNGLTPYKWFSGFDAKVTANGAVIIFGEKVTVFDGSATHELNIKPGIKNEAVFSGGKYLIVTSNGINTSIHRVNASTYAVETTTVSDTGNVALVSMFGCYIAVISSSYNYTFTVTGTDAVITTWLKSIASLIYADRNPVFESGRLTFFDGTNSHYIPFMGSAAVNVIGRAFDDFAITSNGAKSSISRLGGNGSTLAIFDGRLKHITRCGNKLFVLNDSGVLVTYLIGSRKSQLHCSAIKASSKVGYYVRQSLPTAKAVAINIKIT